MSDGTDTVDDGAASVPQPFHVASGGTTIVGDSVLPVGDERGSLAPDAPRIDAVEIEGAAPTIVPDTALTTATAWLFRPGQEPITVSPDTLPVLIAAADNFVWVDLTTYAQSDLQTLGHLLGLHRKAIRAALSPWQRPRLALYPDHFFTSVTIPRLDAAAYQVQASELDLFVGRNYLVSVHKQPLPFADHLLARARKPGTRVP